MSFYQSFFTAFVFVGLVIVAVRYLAPAPLREQLRGANLIYSIVGIAMVGFITTTLLGLLFGIEWTSQAIDLNGALLGTLTALGLTSAVKTIYDRYREKLGKR